MPEACRAWTFRVSRVPLPAGFFLIGLPDERVVAAADPGEDVRAQSRFALCYRLLFVVFHIHEQRRKVLRPTADPADSPVPPEAPHTPCVISYFRTASSSHGRLRCGSEEERLPRPSRLCLAWSRGEDG